MRKRSNEEWVNELRGEAARREEALADLRETILAGLPYALQPWLSAQDARFEALAEEAAQDTLVRVLERLDTFEGRSQFTTWVHKIAVRIALTELRRKRWENVSLDELVEAEDRAGFARLMTDRQAGTPESTVEATDLMRRVERILAEELTGRQRQAMLAMAVQGMPLEEIARRMGTNRNALYKLLHDARLRIKRRLEAEGLSSDDVIEAFAR